MERLARRFRPTCAARLACFALALAACLAVPALALAEAAPPEAPAPEGDQPAEGDAGAEQVWDFIVTYGPKALGVLVFLIVAYFLAKWLGAIVSRALIKAHVEKTLSGFLGSMARWAFLAIALVACLGYFGFATTSFAAVIGAAGLAIGLSLQGSLGNLASGVMLLIFRPFKAGDLVEIGGELGTVEEIQLFSTQMDTPDMRRIIMPNGSVFGSTIENLTFHPKRRVEVDVGVEYSADLDRTREVLMEAARGVPGILEDPEPTVFLWGLGGSSVDWKVRVWANTADFWDIRDAATRAVKVALDSAGLGIPFPQMDVHLDAPAPNAP
jgi:small conductance mechanosensitive channel